MMANYNYKELVVYGMLAIIVVLIVAYALTSGLFGNLVNSTYNVSVSLYQTGSNYSYPYQASHYVINITNTGHSQINGMLVGFYINGVSQNTNTVSIPPGQSIVFLKNYTYPAPGRYTFQAVADPGHVENIPDRQHVQGSVETNITYPEVPNVYTAIPNGNITSTQSFTMSGTGALGVAALSQKYPINMIGELFGPGESVSIKIFENGYAYTANVYGAYARYSNNAVVYTAWLQGTINPQVVNYIIKSFGTQVIAVSSPKQLGYTKINNRTSMCTYYSKGWTKIVSYYNDSMPGTCIGIVANQDYPAMEGNVLIDQITSSNSLQHYQSGLFYTNSTIQGSALAYTMNNLTATNFFQNAYGIFAASITKLNQSRNANVLGTNSICYGLIYSNGTTNICSYLIPTRSYNYTLPYGLINSSYLTRNYSINMYSLVNNTQLIAAHENAANLFKKLDVNESSVLWTSPFKSRCGFANRSIGCTFRNISKLNNTASFNITNKLASTIRINTILCEIAPGFKNVTINETVTPNESIAIRQLCNIIAIPSTAAQTTYMLIMNYTYRNRTRIINGTLNVTNGQSI